MTSTDTDTLKPRVLRLTDLSQPTPLIDSAELRAAVGQISKIVVDTNKALIQSLVPSVDSVVDSLTTQMSQNVRRILKAYESFYAEIQPQLRESGVALAHRGWFPDPSMPISAPIKLAMSLHDNPDDLDRTMAEEYSSQIDSIERQLTHSHLGRSRILRDAFWAHRSAKYSLSVPVFLIQADGIWNDGFGKSIFRSPQRTAIRRSLEEKCRTSLLGLYLLSNNISIWLTENQRDDSFDSMNRHLVLHGSVNSYATKMNSLKAISFLVWTDWITTNSTSIGTSNQLSHDSPQ